MNPSFTEFKRNSWVWNYSLSRGRPGLVHSSSEVGLGMFLSDVLYLMRKDSGIPKKKMFPSQGDSEWPVTRSEEFSCFPFFLDRMPDIPIINANLEILTEKLLVAILAIILREPWLGRRSPCWTEAASSCRPALPVAHDYGDCKFAREIFFCDSLNTLD